MICYDLRVAHEAYLGKALIKVEFRRVSPEYLAQYPVELRSPIQPGEMVSRISNPVPAATLETAYCDKLTALATRPYLKWRDIYDLWWIGTQTDARLDLSSVTRQFLHNVSAYRTIDDRSPAQTLRKFLENDPTEVLKKADPDLRKWLPKALWDKMHPRVTEEMLEYVRGALESVADAIEKNLTDGTAAVCLTRWKEKGLIEGAGERARLYFNKLKCNEVDGSLRIEALLFEYPSALLCGESVHAAGWITQIPARLSVAVISRPSYVSLHGFDIHGRPLSWFKTVHPAVDPSPDKRIYGLRTLPTPLALADLYGDPKGWHPDVDDLDIPQEDAASVEAAATLLGVELPHGLPIRPL